MERENVQFWAKRKWLRPKTPKRNPQKRETKERERVLNRKRKNLNAGKDKDSNPTEPGTTGNKPEGTATGSTQQDGLGMLLQEASSLMKALRPKIKTLSLKQPHCCKAKAQEISTGLLDGGADKRPKDRDC